MAKSRAEILQEIADSTPSGGGNQLRDGRYRFLVKKLALETGFKGPRWTIDLVVKHAHKLPGVVELLTGRPIDVEPNAVGTDVGMVKMLSTKEDYEAPGLGDTKSFVLALYNSTEETTRSDLVATLDELDKTNCAYGMAIDCTTRRKVTDRNKRELVLQDWTHVEQTPEDIKKNRAWMESLVTAEAAAPVVVAGPPAAPKVSGPPAMGPPPGVVVGGPPSA